MTGRVMASSECPKEVTSGGDHGDEPTLAEHIGASAKRLYALLHHPAGRDLNHADHLAVRCAEHEERANLLRLMLRRAREQAGAAAGDGIGPGPWRAMCGAQLHLVIDYLRLEGVDDASMAPLRELVAELADIGRGAQSPRLTRALRAGRPAPKLGPYLRDGRAAAAITIAMWAGESEDEAAAMVVKVRKVPARKTAAEISRLKRFRDKLRSKETERSARKPQPRKTIVHAARVYDKALMRAKLMGPDHWPALVVELLDDEKTS